MAVAAYAILFLSIIGCISYGFIKWSRESTLPLIPQEEEEQKEAVV